MKQYRGRREILIISDKTDVSENLAERGPSFQRTRCRRGCVENSIGYELLAHLGNTVITSWPSGGVTRPGCASHSRSDPAQGAGPSVSDWGAGVVHPNSGWQWRPHRSAHTGSAAAASVNTSSFRAFRPCSRFGDWSLHTPEF